MLVVFHKWRISDFRTDGAIQSRWTEPMVYFIYGMRRKREGEKSESNDCDLDYPS